MMVDTTVGRVLIARDPARRACPSSYVNKTLDKKALSALIDACYRTHRNKETVLLADRLRTLGFEHATRAGISICMDHMVIPDAKNVLLGEAQDEVERVIEQYQEGLITDGERYNKIVDIWAGVADKVTAEMMMVIGKETITDPGDRQGVDRAELQPDLHHGRLRRARLAPSRFVSWPRMRGLMAKPSGEIIENPITANFREGLTRAPVLHLDARRA